MTINFSKFENINESAFLIKSFLDENLCDKIIKKTIIDLNKIKKFNKISNIKLEFYKEEVKKMVDSLLNNGIQSNGFTFVETPKGISWPEHTDSGNWNYANAKKLFGGIIYLNNFSGGDVYYPDTNTKYHPSKGDLIIHDVNTIHGVTLVESDFRYGIVFFIWKRVDK